jgi:cellulose synthase/poly-beta-1,6-N-acetylglucosamine synthase-like glycosyltransferase
MPETILLVIGALYLADVGLLFAFGANFLYLTWVSMRRAAPLHPPDDPTEWPRVTVQLPIYNELYVAERVVRAAARLDYPRDRLEVQVLDDSTDETREILAALVARLRSGGLDIQHVHRTHREGFKAGALAEGLLRAKGEFLAIFDADAVPPRDALRRMVPYFHEPEVAFVQARWTHLDRDYSLFTRLQAIAIDAHFRVEQFARHAAGLWFNFNGSGGVWRRRAIEQSGGWSPETLTEDLDLSYRAWLAGWRARYLDDVEIPAELPAGMGAYRRQQRRWARGSLECALRLLPGIWRSRVPLRVKVASTLHMAGYGVHLLLLGLSLLYPAVLLMSSLFPQLVGLFGVAFALNASALAPLLFLYVGQRRQGGGGLLQIARILMLTATGAGMMLNTTGAALDIFRKGNRVFERTPKYGLENKREQWQARRYQLQMDRIVAAEIALAALNAATTAWAISLGQVFIAFYAGLFSIGLLTNAGMTVAQAVHVAERRTAARRTRADAV